MSSGKVSHGASPAISRPKHSIYVTFLSRPSQVGLNSTVIFLRNSPLDIFRSTGSEILYSNFQRYSRSETVAGT